MQSNSFDLLSNIKIFTFCMNKTRKSNSLNNNGKHSSSNASIKINKMHPHPYVEPHIFKEKTIHESNVFSYNNKKHPYDPIKLQFEYKQQESFDSPTKDRAESVFSQHHKDKLMEQSYVTVRNVQKQRLNKFKIQKQLQLQEQTNAKKAAELRQRKKQEQNKVNLHMGKINNNNELEDYKSVKMMLQNKQMKNEDTHSVKSKNEFKLKNKATIVHKQSQAKNKTQNAIIPIIEIKIEPPNLPQIQRQVISMQETIVHRRLSNSFFYGLHAKIDQIDLQQEHDLIQQWNIKPKRTPFKQSQTLINTKNLLKQLNQQLIQVGLVEPQQDSMDTNNLYEKQQINEILVNESLYESQSKQDSEVQILAEEKRIIMNERVPKLNLRSSLIDYQIVQNAPRVQSAKDKQLLHQQISLLKQVIGQLKVERQRYQAQSERNYSKQATINNSIFHNTHRSSTPVLLYEKEPTHKGTKSSFGNFSQSIVAEFNPKHFRTSSTNQSGKIVKNFSPNKRRIQNKEKAAHRQQQIREQINQTDIKDISTHKQVENKEIENINVIDAIAQNNETIGNASKLSNNNFNQQLSNASNLIPIMTQSINCISQIHSASKQIKSQKIRQFEKTEEHDHNEQIIKKKLIDKFQSMERKSNRSKISQKVQSKLQAHADIVKDIKIKPFSKGQVRKQQNKLLQNESKRSFSNPYKSDIRQSKSTKGFRVRVQPQMIKSLRINSSRQFKSNVMMKKQENAVYIPPRSELFTPNQMTSPKDNNKHYSIHFTEKKNIQKFTVQKRKIAFKYTHIPTFPEAPKPKYDDLIANQIDKINKSPLKSPYQLRKYKNSIIVDLASVPKAKLIWYYTGKLYIGDWNQFSMAKTGQGVQYIPEKYFYKGQFLDDKKNGSGSLVKGNGNLYEGQWLQGEKNGRGKLYDASIKLTYQGEWKNGKKHGYGYFSVENQSVYEGTFSQNHKEGYGTEQFVNGDSYKGQYCKGIFHGKGKYAWACGDYYEGQFGEGCKNGKGKLTLKVGEIYQGYYRNDKKNGKGKYLWQNGCIYNGQFYNDMKHGKGYLIYPDGREIKGFWKEDKLIQFQLQFSNIERQKSASKKSHAEGFTIINVEQTKPNQLIYPGKLIKM